MIIGIGLGVTFPNTGGGADRWAPYPAPSGYYWDFVTSNSEQVTSNGEPDVVLLRA